LLAVTVTGMPVTASRLAGVPLFASLEEQELAETACRFEERTVGEGVDLVGEGAADYCFFVIEDGNAIVTSNGAELRMLGPGDYFGEVGILGEGRRSATVTTTSPARVLVLFGTEFRRLQQEHPEIAARLEAVATERD
jgi:CRP-like cAMP-binding protein